MTATAAKTTRGLGKGLSALMSDSYSQTVKPERAPRTASQDAVLAVPAVPQATAAGALTMLDITLLSAGAYQPRREFNDEYLHELADSIEKNGIMQPILVRPHPRDDGKYEIIAGERRFRAAKLAKLSEVPVMLRALTDKQALELALVENIQRQDLSPLEEAAGYQRLMDEFDYTQEELASTVGKSRSHIANLLRLQSLPDSLKKMLDKGEISTGHARALLGVENAETLAKRVVAEGLNVRQTEQLVKAPDAPLLKAEEKASQAPSVEHRLERLAKAVEVPEKPVSVAKEAVAPIEVAPVSSPTEFIPFAEAQVASPQAKSDDVLALEEMLSSSLGLHVSINSEGASRGNVVIGYASLTQLDEILRRLGGSI